MLAFLPALAPIVLGAKLQIPNVATWWLGRADMREEMLGKLDSMVIAAAFTEQFADGRPGSEILGAKLGDAAGATADRSAALALQPAVADRAHRLGLES